MATSKKKKKSKKRSASSAPARSQPSVSAAPSVPDTPVKSAPVTETSATDEPAIDYEREYSYVSRDLRQLAIVSVSLFVIMLAIGFFI